LSVVSRASHSVTGRSVAGAAPAAVRTTGADEARRAVAAEAAAGRLFDRGRILDLSAEARSILSRGGVGRDRHRTQHQGCGRQSHREFAHWFLLLVVTAAD
jgi:hypothetical protein